MICIICINPLLYKSGKLQRFVSWHFACILPADLWAISLQTPTYSIASHSQNNAGINKCLANLRQKRSPRYCTRLIALSHSSGSGSDLSHRVRRSRVAHSKRDSILGMRFTQMNNAGISFVSSCYPFVFVVFYFPHKVREYTRERCRQLQNTQTRAGLSSC